MDKDTQLADIADELAAFLETDPFITLNYQGEEDPFRLEFFYAPSPDRLVRLSTDRERSGSIVAAESRESAQVTVPRNMKCSLCSDKMYALRRYRKAPADGARILVITYAGRIDSGEGFRDRTDEWFFNSEEEEELFSRMVRAAGMDPESGIVYQQYPGCVFNAERSSPEDWNRRNTNCLELIAETIKEYKIKVILATGSAAVFLTGEEIAKKHSVSGKPLDFAAEDGILPLYIIRSPAAILAYEKKRNLLKKKAAEDPAAKKQLEDHLQAEKDLKNSILKNLKTVTEKHVL